MVKEIILALSSLLYKSLTRVYQGESVAAWFSLLSQRLLHRLTFREAIFWVVVLDSQQCGYIKAGFSLFKAHRPDSWCIQITQCCQPMVLFEPTTSRKTTTKQNKKNVQMKSVVLVHQEQLSDHFHFIFRNHISCTEGSGGGSGRGLLEPIPAVPGGRKGFTGKVTS